MSQEFDSLNNLLFMLRKECEWDKKQTLGSLTKHIVEEAYELVHAIREYESTPNPANLQELKSELGDLLIQPMLQCVIASETTDLDISEVIKSVEEKLIRRHPHVFDKGLNQDQSSIEKKWQEIKDQEEKDLSKKFGSSSSKEETALEKYKHLPAFTVGRKTIKHYDYYKHNPIDTGSIDKDNVGKKLVEMVKWAKENNVDLEYELIKSLEECS